MHANKIGEPKAPRGQNANVGPCTSLYIGNLHHFITTPMLQDLCNYFGPVESVKIIKDKSSGTSAGYGFVKFSERKSAEAAIHALNGKLYLNNQLRVNWAFQSQQKEDTSNHVNIFVGDLGHDVTDSVLFNSFRQCEGCSDARVMWDHSTGRSKGYGFVAFRTHEQAEQAIKQMNLHFVGSRKVRCGWAQHKQDDNRDVDYETVHRADPSNTNVYIGNIAAATSEQDVRNHFAGAGTIIEVKVHKKGGYGFVRYEHHAEAVHAILTLHGSVLAGQTLKCSWGKNQDTIFSNPQGSLFASPAAIPMMVPGMAGMSGIMTSPPPAPLWASQMGLSAASPVMMMAPANNGGPRLAHPGAAMAIDPQTLYYQRMYYGQQ